MIVMKTIGPTVSYTKNQHYVWRHYLNAWAEFGSFWCYRQQEKRVFPTKPRAIANETYFYEVHKLTEEDIEFLNAFIARATDKRLRDLHWDFLQLTQKSFSLREQLQNMQLPQEVGVALERELRIAETTLGEHYHTGIENRRYEYY